MTSKAKTIEELWYKNPKDFFLNAENLIKFIPDAKMTLNEQLNAAFRFSVYFSVVVGTIRQDVRVLFFAVFVGIVTFIIGYNEDQKSAIRENLMQEMNLQQDRKKRVCSLPTKENPFMNVLISDYKTFPTKPAACSINNKDVKKSINEYSENMYMDADDVFAKNSGDRQFYTNPATTIPNSQTEFAHWLYNNGATCKERPIVCKPQF